MNNGVKTLRIGMILYRNFVFVIDNPFGNSILIPNSHDLYNNPSLKYMAVFHRLLFRAEMPGFHLVLPLALPMISALLKSINILIRLQ